MTAGGTQWLMETTEHRVLRTAFDNWGKIPELHGVFPSIVDYFDFLTKIHVARKDNVIDFFSARNARAKYGKLV